MNLDINLKSAACGAAACGLALLAIGAADQPPTETGRYQIAGGAGTFATLDTVTGQTWIFNMGTEVTRNSPNFLIRKDGK